MPSLPPSIDLEGSSDPDKVADPDESGSISDTLNNGQKQSATESNDPLLVVQSTQDDSDSESDNDSRRSSEQNSPGFSQTLSAAIKRRAHRRLTFAIFEGDLDAVKEAIESGADVKNTDWITETALHLACRFGHELIVEHLLEDEDNLQCLAEVDVDGWTPLISACSENRSGTKKIVELLLSHGDQLRIEARSNKGRTALHMACSESSEEVVQLLLDSNAEVNVYDRRNCTPLTIACETMSSKIVSSLLALGAKCDVADDDGDTPLILASRYGDPNMVREILEKNPDSLYRENKSGEDALRSAILNLDARDRTIPLLLDKGFRIVGDDAVRQLVEDMLKPPDARSDENIRAAIKSILEHSSKADRVSVILHVDDQHFDLLWDLKEDLGVDRKICQRIRKWPKELLDDKLQKSMQRPGQSEETKDPDPQSPLQLSAFHGEHILVWYLLKESQSENKEDIKKALAIAEARKQGSRTKVASESDKKGKKPDHAKDSEKPKVDVHSKRFDYTIDILNNATKLAISKRQIIRPSRDYMDEKKDLLRNYRATIVSLYERDGQTDLLQSSSSVFDLVYGNEGDRVNDVMERARSIFDGMTNTTPDKEMSENGLRLRWIHLPVNNMDWMEHLTLRIYDARHGGARNPGDDKKLENDKKSEDDKKAEDDEYLTSFMDLARRSRKELPTDKSDVKFMKPICLREESGIPADAETRGPEEKSQQNVAGTASARRLALYTPFVTFGYCYPPQKRPQNENNATLRKDYKGCMLHETRSLDRFYYNALESSEMDNRDMSQVVTRRLLDSKMGDPLKDPDGGWPYLTVDQLWLWVIDNDTIISSSTHRDDGFDTLLVEKVWESLLQASQAGFGENLPSTVTGMSRFLVNTCVEFINNPTWEGVCKEKPSQFKMDRSAGDANSKPILLLYADSINDVAAKEKELFKEFKERTAQERKERKDAVTELKEKIAAENQATGQGRPIQQDAENIDKNKLKNLEKDEKDWEAIDKAATLLEEVKDIRDELVILQSLVTQQDHVWAGLMGPNPDSHDARSPTFVVHELDAMIKMTDTIQESIKNLLNLEENSIDIKESMTSRDLVDKTAKQGERMIALTESSEKQSESLVILANIAHQQGLENSKQEKVLFAFAIVTVIFTPMSFMTSILALNTSSSRHNDDGELEWEPMFMYWMIFGVSAAIVAPFLGYAFLHKVKKLLLWLISSSAWVSCRIGLMYTMIAKSVRGDVSPDSRRSGDEEKGLSTRDNTSGTPSDTQLKKTAG